MVQFSVFAPVYNEQGNIVQLYRELVSVMDTLGSWELLLVNDGSRDGSLQEMLSIRDSRVRVIDLKRNYGQAIAMDVGFRYAKGDYIISIDADLQNDPRDIPRLFAKMQDKKLDVVCGWRKKRKDPVWMLVITRVARSLRSIFASDGIHDSGCTLRIYKRSFVADLELWGEMHRYIVALLRWRGARVGELIVHHRPRVRGYTKYTWKKSFKGFVDLLYIWFWKKFSARPLHLFGITGLFIGFFGVLSGLWSVYLKFIQGTSLSNSGWMLLSSFLMLAGMQLFIAGVTLDLLIRTYYNSSSIESRYGVEAEFVGGKKKK